MRETVARFLRLAVLCLVTASVVLLGSVPVLGRTSDAPPRDPQVVTAVPNYYIAGHDIGKMVLSVLNNGTFGDGFSPTCADDQCSDSFTGLAIQSCEYPKGSRTKYLFAGAFWIGGVIGNDTLVTTGADGWSSVTEFHPEEGELGRMLYRSTVDPAAPAFEGAVSEQDYIAVYYDTCTNCPGNDLDFLDNRRHRPLNIEVTQRSFAWSYSYAEDIVLFDYGIRNIGTRRLQDVFLGVYVDADIHQIGDQNGAQDDICGFHEKLPALYLPPSCPPDSDVVNIAWTADNDGDLGGQNIPVPNITATRIVRTPADSLQVSFNWWISNADPAFDFGPQARETFRNLQTGGLGTPEGDRAKYHFLSNQEFDYDQVQVNAIGATDPVWLPPPPNQKATWARGLDTRYLLSFGPFDIEPGQTLPLSFAYVAGENFHSDADNLENLPDDWEAYYEGVSFDSLGTNATWADWIYDNPGFDTDSDGYFGEYTICATSDDSTLVVDTTIDSSVIPFDTTIDSSWQYASADTVWRKGDGVPDFKGASPPPAPATYSSPLTGKRGLRVEPFVGGARVVWNGVASENTVDVFSREQDFEGYRIYQARDERPQSYSLLASYDIEDYNKYEWVAQVSEFRLLESPFSLEELRDQYGDGDTTWHPLDYPRNRPYINPNDPTEILYFEPQDYNRSILANDPVNANTPIAKVFPTAPFPPADISGLMISDPDSLLRLPDSIYNLYLTEDGFLKYYEYEYRIEGQLASVPYWINVTAFDYGSPRSGLASLETPPTILPANTYFLESSQEVARQGLEVFVYPNPYREDADYVERGFEGRGEIRARDRLRRIHFANLPPKCTISIFSLDGDLIREIPHDFSPDDPLANHDTWDLITRNTQLVVSGLYYWTVEDDKGNVQIGKLVIIL